jgi:hypothetical protein
MLLYACWCRYTQARDTAVLLAVLVHQDAHVNLPAEVLDSISNSALPLARHRMEW